jgi:hypothetical protein
MDYLSCCPEDIKREVDHFRHRQKMKLVLDEFESVTYDLKRIIDIAIDNGRIHYLYTDYGVSVVLESRNPETLERVGIYIPIYNDGFKLIRKPIWTIVANASSYRKRYEPSIFNFKKLIRENYDKNIKPCGPCCNSIEDTRGTP